MNAKMTTLRMVLAYECDLIKAFYVYPVQLMKDGIVVHLPAVISAYTDINPTLRLKLL